MVLGRILQRGEKAGSDGLQRGQRLGGWEEWRVGRLALWGGGGWGRVEEGWGVKVRRLPCDSPHWL